VTAKIPASVARRSLGSAFALAAVGLGILALAVHPRELGNQAWKGYRVLLVDAVVPEAEVLASLKAAGIENVLSESTEPAIVSDWCMPETMSLVAARASLARGDPRLDPYLQRLGLWFEARAGSASLRVYYIETELVSFIGIGFESRVSAALQRLKARFILADEGKNAPVKGSNALYFLCAAAVLILAAVCGPMMGKASSSIRESASRTRGRRTLDRIAFRLSLLAPWAFLACGGRSAAAIAALWGLALVEIADRLDIALDDGRLDGGRGAALGSLLRQRVPSLVLPATALLAFFLSPGSIASVAIACMGSFAAMAGYALATTNPTARRCFVPVPIGRAPRRHGSSMAEIARGLLACSVIVLWALGGFFPLTALTAAPTGIAYPTPVAIPGSARPTPSEARSRSPSEVGATLPGIASYLEHKAFQEALPFVPVGESRADPFAIACLPLPDGKARTQSFDEGWARRAYESLPSLSVEGMLLVQGSATVARADVELAAPSERPLAPIECLLYIFLLVPPLARLFRGIPLARGALSGELRQEA
jgi:hypothetical protein